MQSVAIGGFHHQIIRFVNSARGFHDGIMWTADVSSKHNGTLLGFYFDHGRTDDVTGTMILKTELMEQLMRGIKINGFKIL
ncbi:Uncharacterised protein [Legionella pneumophila]|nr:Uncharacterised protein [Legionella pneumophila]CZJ32092.1 Uncharacterised protein [Legionella pneumophila]CZJ37382.1 Uncharacterised protein [Legionella pneumophila]CZJ39300.1 Uncharacterised protein [Legionella pneumophila]